MHPFKVRDMGVASALGNEVSAAVALAKIFDDRARFGDQPSTIVEQRRFSERMNGEQFGRCEIGRRVTAIMHNRIVGADFFEQPQNPLRPAVVQMMDDQAHGILPRAALQRMPKRQSALTCHALQQGSDEDQRASTGTASVRRTKIPAARPPSANARQPDQPAQRRADRPAGEGESRSKGLKSAAA